MVMFECSPKLMSHIIVKVKVAHSHSNPNPPLTKRETYTVPFMVNEAVVFQLAEVHWHPLVNGRHRDL